eukprot:gene7925-7340_t
MASLAATAVLADQPNPTWRLRWYDSSDKPWPCQGAVQGAYEAKAFGECVPPP